MKRRGDTPAEAGAGLDWFEAGETLVDYRVKPGPVTRSNVITLMEAVGLKACKASARL